MSTENIYLKQMDEIIRPAIEQLNTELSSGSNYRIELEEGNSLKTLVPCNSAAEERDCL